MGLGKGSMKVATTRRSSACFRTGSWFSIALFRFWDWVWLLVLRPWSSALPPWHFRSRTWATGSSHSSQIPLPLYMIWKTFHGDQHHSSNLLRCNGQHNWASWHVRLHSQFGWETPNVSSFVTAHLIFGFFFWKSNCRWDWKQVNLFIKKIKPHIVAFLHERYSSWWKSKAM